MTVLVGSGVTPEQVKPLFEYADALIIGSWIKQGGVWDRPVDAERCKAMAQSRDQ
jgi:predicted TIM-barrel enzyme